MFGIIDELNAENGSNYKLAVLKKHADNELFKRVLKMAYDKVAFTYGVTMKNVDTYEPTDIQPLEYALDILENKLCIHASLHKKSRMRIRDRPMLRRNRLLSATVGS